MGALAPLNDQELKYSALYLQDQIWLGERWKLLLGLRYDDTRQTTVSSSGTTVNDDGKYSPRAGIMYDVAPWASLYASYSRSFVPTVGTSFDGTPFEPETGDRLRRGSRLTY